MNIIKSICRIAALSIAAISFVGCENDFDTLGSNVIGEPGYDADLYDEAPVTATNVDLGPVQTNNLPVNLLGYYQNDVFGTQTASIVSQLFLAVPGPTFGEEAVLDSVVLKIPYFSHEIEADDDGNKRYELDSIIGNTPIKLTVAESGYFLNAFDPETDFQKSQKYYSNLKPEIEANLTGNILYQNDNFLPSKKGVVEYGIGNTTMRDTTYKAPALNVHLSPEFFKQKIQDMEGSLELSSNSYFQNYFRGVYIKAEPVEQEGTMMLLDLTHAEAGITMYFSKEGEITGDEDADSDTEEPVRAVSAVKLKFGQARVNLFDQTAPTFEPGKLFLRGGEGAMATIDLFAGVDSDGDGVSDELEFLRGNEWLINEANLTFFVDRDKMAGSREPERLFLYDLDNNRVLMDYVFENPGSSNAPDSKANLIHSVPLERDENEDGIKYKLRLTRHIHNILNKDSTNVRLGLVITENINLITNSAVKDSEVDKVPSGSLLTPLGTVLHSPDSSDDEKRLKLNIYYTASKE